MTTLTTTIDTTSSDSGVFKDWSRLDGVSYRTSARGAAVYSPGEPAETVFLLKAGKVKIVRLGPEGKRLIVHLVGPGELFGELSLIGSAYRESAAEILEDAGFWVIPTVGVQGWLGTHPEAWREVAFHFGKRVRYLEGAVERLLFGEVEQRIVRLLLELAKQYGEPTSTGVNLKIELSQKELAHLIGSTRETTSSALNILAKRGLIQIRRRHLSICSMAELSQVIQKQLPPKMPPASEGLPRVAAVRIAAAGQ